MKKGKSGRLRVFEVFDGVKGKSEEEKNYVINSLHEELGDEEFHRQMFIFADNITNQQSALHEQIHEIKKTPDWLFEEWIKMSEICLLLYGKKDNSTTGKFIQKRDGKKKWKQEELDKLEDIRRTLLHKLAQA